MSTPRIGLWLLLIAWSGIAALGMRAMVAYETTSAPILEATEVWPESADVDLDPKRPTLVMFVHPRCPCSRASLAELAKLASQCKDRVRLCTVFVQPAGSPECWTETPLWSAAGQIPVTRLTDREGKISQQFRATTSGETFLYAPDGRLLFHGGMTHSRGHEGENVGRATVVALINRGVAERKQSRVYGCCLQDHCLPASASTHASASPHD
jgi:hypothetical protein